MSKNNIQENNPTLAYFMCEEIKTLDTKVCQQDRYRRIKQWHKRTKIQFRQPLSYEPPDAWPKPTTTTTKQFRTFRLCI